MAKDNSVEEVKKEIAELDQQIVEAKQIQEQLLEERKPVYSVYKWDAPERVFEIKDRKWYLGVSIVAMVIIVLSALTGNYLLIFTVIVVILLLYAVNSIPPEQVTHEITNKGINVFGELTLWKNIESFWVSTRGEHTFINFDIKDKKGGSPHRVILLSGNGDTKRIVTYLVQYVDYLSPREGNLNFMTKIIYGEHKQLLPYLTNTNVVTKDPKDSPALQKEQAVAPEKKAEAKKS